MLIKLALKFNVSITYFLNDDVDDVSGNLIKLQKVTQDVLSIGVDEEVEKLIDVLRKVISSNIHNEYGLYAESVLTQIKNDRYQTSLANQIKDRDGLNALSENIEPITSDPGESCSSYKIF